MESPVRAWLELQCQMIAGAEAGLVVTCPAQRGAAPAEFAWPPEKRPVRALAASVERAHELGKLDVQPPEDATAATQIAVPLEVDGELVGAVGISVRGVPPTEIRALAGLIGYGVRGLAQLLEAQRRCARLADRLALAGELLEQERLADAAHAFAAGLARSLRCERVSLGLRRRGKLRVVGLSTSVRLAEESDAVRELAAAMQEAVEQDAVIELPVDAPLHAIDAHERLAADGSAALCTVPLASRGRAVGAFTCEWGRPDALDARSRGLVREAALVCGPIVDLLDRASAGIARRAAWSLARQVERHFGSDRALAKYAFAAVAALIVLLAVVPGSYRLSARATIEGRVQRALVAGVAGYVAEANARAGDLVRSGDVIARLDDRDLRLERRQRASEMAQMQKEYRGALASGDRTRVSVLQAQIDQADAKLGLAEEQLGRTNVIAPFDGIILEGDLDRSLGSPVELGTVLFEIAPLDGYRIIIEVDGRDIADVGVGQRGRLALTALPDRPLPLVVERVTPVSTVENGRSYFRVEATLEQPIGGLRPGMEGVARIDAGRRRLLWIWTHELLDWLRLLTWTFLP